MLKEIRILLMFEREEERSIYALGLERLGAEVVAVGSPDEAIATARPWGAMVLVADLSGEYPSAVEFVRRFRELVDQGVPKTLVIVLTGLSTSDPNRLNHTGAIDILCVKPCTPGELARCISTWYAAAAEEEPPPEPSASAAAAAT